MFTSIFPAHTSCISTILAGITVFFHTGKDGTEFVFHTDSGDHALAISPALLMFLFFVAITLAITYFSARKSSGSSAYFAAGRRITGWQNGLAVAGDYMSAASFLGIAGMIAFKGYDGFMYSVGWLVAYLTVLLIVAEPLRNTGKYTMADMLAYRLHPRDRKSTRL